MKKKYLLLLSALLIAVLSAGIVACGDDDDDEGGGNNNIQNVLLGTWSSKVTGNCTGTESWTFNKGGNGALKMNTTCNSGTFPFTYTVLAYDPSSGIGYVRLIYSEDNYKTDQEFTVKGNTLYFGGTYTK